MNEQKNLILAISLSALILLGWQIFIAGPQREEYERQQAEIAAQQAEQQPQQEETTGPQPELGAEMPAVAPEALGAGAGASREEALKASARVAIESGRLSGSIALNGARFDDLTLLDYRESVEEGSPNIVLLEPTGSALPYYVQLGWLTQDNQFLGHDATWTADSDTLTPDSPVTLTWDSNRGLVFERTVSVDENYMFTVTQRVRNTGAAPATLSPYGLVSRTGTPEILDFYILHEGLLGVFDGTLKEIDYDELEPGKPIRQDTTGGWFGITDKYWLVALAPEQAKPVKTSFSIGSANGESKYQTDYLYEPVSVPVGGTVETTSRFFAGAKEVTLLDRYENELGIPNFDLAVDFGWFYFLTKPIFHMLHWFHGFLGNFGLAILALTVVIKGLLFPLANKSYKSMSKMKLLGPKMQEMKERYGDDRMRLNQEMMELYKREKVNPAAGCLPIIPQAIIFFALYKVLFVSIEMRHAPFYGWIKDLSAQDPLGVLTLFGLIDWNVPLFLEMLNIGIWPILMGTTMYLQQKLNPTPPDPTQAKIMMMLPFIFTFILGSFPAGLVIYWTWNNLLSIAQQWVIMRGVERDNPKLSNKKKKDTPTVEDVQKKEEESETESGGKKKKKKGKKDKPEDEKKEWSGDKN